jgi:hypothetical protein
VEAEAEVEVEVHEIEEMTAIDIEAMHLVAAIADRDPDRDHP